MTTPNAATPGTDMVLSDRQSRLLSMRDEMAPGSKPGAIVPRTFAEAQAMCHALAEADLVPKAFRKKPVEMLVVVMSGAEIGIPPMAALRLYTCWDGVPRLMAEGIRAVIVSHPDIEYFEPANSSDVSATWVAKRRGRPEKTATWTIERARRAGLTEKDTWRKYPEDMLNARASMQLGRMIAPDIVAGMVSREEAMDGDVIEVDYTEKPAGFVAPEPMGAVFNPNKPSGTVTTIGAAVDMPRRGPGRPPKDKSDPTPPATSSASTSPAASSSPSPARSESTSPHPVSSSSMTPTDTDSSSTSKLEEATKAAREADARRSAAPPVSQDPGLTGPTTAGSGQPSATVSIPSTSSESTSDSTTTGADLAGDDGFGAAEDHRLVPREFYEWLSSCKTQRDLAEGLPTWRTWSANQHGKPEFKKAIGKEPAGKGIIEMQDAYAKRKAEVPA